MFMLRFVLHCEAVLAMQLTVPGAASSASAASSANNLSSDAGAQSTVEDFRHHSSRYLTDGMEPAQVAIQSSSNQQRPQLPTRVFVAASCLEIERFAAGLLVDRLNSATNSSAFHLATEMDSSQPAIAVGFEAASLAFGTYPHT